MIVRSLVIDPYSLFGENRRRWEEFRSLIESRSIRWVSNIIENTITRWTYFLPDYESLRGIPSIEDLICLPATVTLTQNRSLSAFELNGIITIVKSMANRLLAPSAPIREISNLIFTINNDRLLYRFTPRLASGERIYRSQERLYKFMNLPLEDWVGLKVLSADPLMGYLLKGNREISYSKKRGIYLTSIDFDPTEIRSDLESLRASGTFLLRISEPGPEVAELLDRFELQGIGTISDYLILRRQTDDEPLTSSWLSQTLIDLRRNRYPAFLVGGTWQQEKWALGNQSKLVLAAVLAYTNLIKIDPTLIPYLPQIAVTAGLDIKIYIKNKPQIGEFRSAFKRYLDLSDRWSVLPVKDIIEGLVWRAFYQDNGVYVPTLLVRREGSYFIVIATSDPTLLPEPTETGLEPYRSKYSNLKIEYSPQVAGLIGGNGLTGLLI